MSQLGSFFSLLSNFLYDFLRYFKYSSAVHPPEKLAQLEAKIAARYHNIEKGLSLPNIRLGFGKEKIEILFHFLDRYATLGYDQNRQTFQTALAILHAYIHYHETHNYDVSWITKKLQNYTDNHTDFGGTITLAAEEIIKKESGNFASLTQNRHSVRNFANQKVDLKIIEKAVSIAQQSPSVCNRQSGRAHIIQNKKLKTDILSLHRGNGGFGHTVDTVILITADLRTFTHVGERYQAYIDGSLFGMSLIYALHSLGLATCTLNWSVTKNADQKMHKLASIPDNETIVFLIAVGHYPQQFEVAKSKRLAISEIMRIVE